MGSIVMVDVSIWTYKYDEKEDILLVGTKDVTIRTYWVLGWMWVQVHWVEVCTMRCREEAGWM